MSDSTFEDKEFKINKYFIDVEIDIVHATMFWDRLEGSKSKSRINE